MEQVKMKYRTGISKITRILLLCGTVFILNQFYLTAQSQRPVFTEIAKKSGLNFVHFNGMSGELYFPEMTGQGGGMFDYDNDGDMDIYLLQGNMLGQGKTHKDALFPPKDKIPRDRLFRNDSFRNKKGEMVIKFVDVTDRAGLKMTGYGMGIATGDFNNDGWIDLYITNYGPNVMLFNNGDGTFRDVTKQSGTEDLLWGASAVAFDYDKDGWLDLYISNYVHFDLKENKKCYAKSSMRDYCGPSSFLPQRDRFFRNKGNGSFEDVTGKVLIDYKAQAGLGVIVADFNADGWLDLYVANDGHPNQMWINHKGKYFKNDSLFAGVALNQDGQAEASMGVGVGDIDADGDDDLFMTHIMGETNTLYINDGNALFEDKTAAYGLSAASFPYTSFGTNFFDYDNDGWLDIFVANGAVLKIEKLALAGDPYPIHQPNQLYRNINGKKFIDVTGKAERGILLSEVSRGSAFGDIDNDGDCDIVVFNNNGKVRLLRNNSKANNWLGVKLYDPKRKREMIGSKVALIRKGKPTLWRYVRTGGSYCSANDSRILFGLGNSTSVDALEIHWLYGSKTVVKNPKINRYIQVDFKQN